jgi:hypothetical protein
VLLPIAAWTTWDYVEARRFARTVDQIRAKGEPVSIVRVSMPSESREEAMRHYEAAAALIRMAGLYSPTGILAGVRSTVTAIAVERYGRVNGVRCRLVSTIWVRIN